jgi:hypothetical protein
MMTNYRPILQEMIEYTDDFDSPNFCVAVVANSMDEVEKEL